MAGERSVRSWLAVVVSIAVAAVAGLLVTAAALDGDGNDATTTTARPPSTTTTAAREFPSGQEWSIVTALVAPGGATTTTTATTTTVAGPPPVSPPAPGEYTYAERTDGGEGGNETLERLYRIEDRPPAEGEQRAPGELQFLITLETDAGSVTTITSWRPDVVLALQTVFRMPETEASCDWVPDLVQLQLPMSSEATWSNETACTADFGSQQIEIARSGEFQVRGDERITVAGQELAVWRVESKETTRFRGAFERTDQVIRTWWFSPKYGLTVREEGRQRHTTPGGTSDSTVERELMRLRPV